MITNSDLVERAEIEIHRTHLALILFSFLFISGLAFSQVDKGRAFSKYPKSAEPRFLKAEKAYTNRQWDEAFSLYKGLSEEFPQISLAHIGLAASAKMLGDYPKAVIAFRRALELLPDDPNLQGELADAYRLNDQLDEAEKWYQSAVEAEKGEPSAGWYIGLGLIETARGGYEKARQYYIAAVLIDPKATIAYQNLGAVLMKLNRLDEADAAFKAALEQDDKVAIAIFGRGQIAAKRRNFHLAGDLYRQALQLDPQNPAFYYAYAQALFRLDNRSEAQKAIAKYRRYKAELYLQESRQFLKESQWKTALAKLQKSVESDPTFTEAIAGRAYVQLKLGAFDDAKKSYEQILTIDPNSLEAQINLGIVEAQLGHFQAAESIYLNLIRLNPDFTDSYVHLSQAREIKGDLAGSEAALDLGIQQQLEWAPGYWWRGQIRQKLGNTAGAEVDFRSAIKLAPKAPFPKNSLARLLAESGEKLDEALKLSQMAVAEEPSPEHRATLALVYYSLNRIDDAQRQIESAYQEDPNNPQVLSIRAKILNLPLGR